MPAWPRASPTWSRRPPPSRPSRRSPVAWSAACAAGNRAQPVPRRPIAPTARPVASRLAHRDDGEENGGMIDSLRYPRLARIDSPADLRKFDESELPAIADELRAYLIESVGRSGGHFGAGLGVIELTVAL